MAVVFDGRRTRLGTVLGTARMPQGVMDHQRSGPGRRAATTGCAMLGASREGDMTVEHPNAKSMWTTIEVDKDGVETVLVVETDLELNASGPAFDVAKVDALIDAAMKSFAVSGGTIDRVRLVPMR